MRFWDWKVYLCGRKATANWRANSRTAAVQFWSVLRRPVMNSVDLLKGIYHSHLKPEPSKISETLGACFSLLSDGGDVLPEVLRLADLSSSPLQKSAQDIISKWSIRIVELVSSPPGTGEDRNRAAALVLFAHLLSNASFELMHSHKDQWISTLTAIVNRVRTPSFISLEAQSSLHSILDPLFGL